MEIVSRSETELEEQEEGGVYRARLATGSEMNAELFRIEPGAGAAEHSHPHEQLGYVLGTEGAELTFYIGGSEEFTVTPGDSYVIPGNEVHSTENKSDAVVENLNFFSPPRDARNP